MAPVIHWFRRDLRLDDNTALNHALLSADPVLPLFILDDYILEHVGADDPRRGQLLVALIDLDAELRLAGSGLVLRSGDAARELNHVAEEMEAWGVYFNRDYTLYARQRDTRATRGLQLTGVVTQVFDDRLLVSPYALVGDDLGLPETFPDFRKQWLGFLDIDPEPAPRPDVATFLAAADAPASTAGWQEALGGTGAPSPDGLTPARAHDELRRFVADLLPGYGGGDAAAAAPLAGLGPALRLGTLSVREVARAVLRRAAADPRARPGAEHFIDDLARTEYAVHRRYADPTAPTSALESG